MSTAPAPTIRIAAALIDDDSGRMLLVRKAGTPWFMQAGGKIEPGETPFRALQRELLEEVGLALQEDEARYIGQFFSPAANEAGHVVQADMFHVRVRPPLAVGAEIEEAVWVDLVEAEPMPLAPLTRTHVLPLASRMRP
jgi:8-oxo-dGTP diphosphatase